MDQVDEISLLDRLFALRDAKQTAMAADVRFQSTRVYGDAGHVNSEINALFRGRPLIAVLAADLPQCGDHMTVELGSVSVIVVRSENASVRAFLNACRHRGSRLAEGRGPTNRVFRCPYHAWVYDIDGRLLGQPVAKAGFAGIDSEKTGLIELPATEVYGVILVGATPDARIDNPDTYFAGLGPELGEHAFDTWHLVGEREKSWQMNWKLPYETFLEAYHIFALHRESLAKEVLATPMLSDFFGPHGRGVLTGRHALELQELDREQWSFKGNANLVYWLFPNTVLSMPMTGHAELWQFYPGRNPGECRVSTRFYTPTAPKSDKEHGFWQRMVEYTMNVVETEDFVQQQAIQRNVESGIFPRRIFGRNEPALIHYHESLDHALNVDTRFGPEVDIP